MTIKHTILTLSLVAGCATDTDLDTTTQASMNHPILLPASGTGQNREVMSGFDPLVVTLTDTYGTPVAGATITFTSPVSGASASFQLNGQTETDENGRAELRGYANQWAGTYTVWAHADGADPMPFVLTNSAAGPAHTYPVIGSNQARPTGMMFAQPLTVEVRDNYGNLVSNAPVHFVAPMSGATTQMSDGGLTVTNEDGLASVFATAGMTPGTYTVQALVSGSPAASFTLTNMDGGIVFPELPYADLHIEGGKASR